MTKTELFACKKIRSCVSSSVDRFVCLHKVPELFTARTKIAVAAAAKSSKRFLNCTANTAASTA